MHSKKHYDPPKVTGFESHANVPEILKTTERLRTEAEEKIGLKVRPDYKTVVDAGRRFIEVSDSFCQLIGYERADLIGKTYDELTATNTNDIRTVYHLFIKNGYMHGLWMLVHRTGKHILVRYESWVRPDCRFESNIELAQ